MGIASPGVDLPTDNMQNFNFLAFSLLLLPASLVALQCYETTGTLSINNLVQSNLKNCTAGQFCNIAGKNDTYAIRQCIGSKTHSGCVTLLGFTTCFCEVDGCNENFAKASGRNNIMDYKLFFLVLSYMLYMMLNK